MCRTKTSSRVNLAVAATIAFFAGTQIGQAQAPAAQPPRGTIVLPDSHIGARVAPILLLTRQDVQTDLRLTPAQTAGAQQMANVLHERAATLRGRSGNDVMKAQDEILRDGKRWVTENLAEEQKSRLVQLDLQWEGPSALLSRPIIKDSLRLEDTQITGLSKAIAQRNTKRNGGPAIAADEVVLFNTMVGMLSKPQIQAYRAMLGPIAPFQTAIHPMRGEAVLR